MESFKGGQRFLLALASLPDNEDNSSLEISDVHRIFVAASGIACLLAVVLLCTCKSSGKEKSDQDIELQKTSKKSASKSSCLGNQDGGDNRAATVIHTVQENGGLSSSIKNNSGHSRQASSSSAHNIRPTSLRELPEPPVTSMHTRNISASGVELPDNSDSWTSNAGNALGAGHEKVVVTSNSDGYDHLGPKPFVRPTDYECLEPKPPETPISEMHSNCVDSHYSQVKERTYDVVCDVRAKSTNVFDPYSHIKDTEDSSSGHYSQVKEEDPYNHIGDSDGVIPSSLARRLRSEGDSDDPYATVQDSGGDREPQGAVGGVCLPQASRPTQLMHQSPSGDVTDEYAVVRKSRGITNVTQDSQGRTGTEDCPLYLSGASEPNHTFQEFEVEAEEDHYSEATPTRKSGVKEHKYSKVSARESLASMTARKALNPYEIVPDLPENTYATVEGGSGDGVVGEAMLRGGATGGNETNRLSQSSDTYAEIAISGGGLTTSVTSNSSSTGGGTNNNSGSSGAPVPPSLDSLHLMTKSQTSSEGDRHLASPEDTGISSLQAWDDGEGSGGSTEDGYSTLKRPESMTSPGDGPALLRRKAGRSMVTDAESGEVTLVSSYQSVKDCLSDDDDENGEAENDPNYESVEETQVKVAALKERESAKINSWAAKETNSGASSHVTVVQITHSDSNSGRGENSCSTPSSSSEPRQYGRRGRSGGWQGGQRGQSSREHDYEEVDLSPPVSPSHSAQLSPASPLTPVNALQDNAGLSSPEAYEARERILQSHMYEELVDVRLKKQEMVQKSDKGKRGAREERRRSRDEGRQNGSSSQADGTKL